MIEQRNLILAVVLSVAIVVAFDFFYRQPLVEQQQRQQQTTEATQQAPSPQTAPQPAPGTAPTVPSTAPSVPGAAAPAPAEPSSSFVPGSAQAPVVTSAADQAARAAAIDRGRRLRLESPSLRGSINLDGARIDDLTLLGYRETIDPNSAEIFLLSPTAAPSPYYVDFGWVAEAGAAIALPGAETPWRAEGGSLTPGNPVRLTWDNGAGLSFTRTLSVDENYMFSITQRVVNATDAPVILHPYGLISRTDTPEVTGFYILHEGPLGVFEKTLEEVDYDDLTESPRLQKSSTGGWIGITDKYWLTALIPDQAANFTASFNYSKVNERDKYQTDYLRGAAVVPAGGVAEITNHLFAGAKRVKLLDAYERQLGIMRFDLTIDWGWFYFLTRPIFVVLDYFNGVIGNFGLAILLLTVIIKILFFPLANKSYKAMGKMKKLQPEVTKMRERFAEDKQRLNQEMMALYKKEKVNPMAGCLPIAIQIPVFFALYKVLFVTIEMRHAPFYGWIVDLSAQDPTNMFNLFGLIPWTPPAIIPAIGIWPLLMGISMFLQQKLNPQPPDPVQAKIFMFLPVFFTFLLATFPAGLVIYWTWNNLLSMAQQWVIMRRAGAT
jgi:YidC/Oxa1 family membrane protein insertase